MISHPPQQPLSETQLSFPVIVTPDLNKSTTIYYKGKNVLYKNDKCADELFGIFGLGLFSLVDLLL
jgi:hypothetical protein